MAEFKLPAQIIKGHLLELHRAFKAGDRNALIMAVRFCMREKAVMPEWVVAEFFKATNLWYGMKVKELGSAFGLDWPKGPHFNAVKNKRRLKFAVHNRVVELHSAGHAINIELFKKIGKELALGKTLVSEYYYAAKAARPGPSAIDELLAPFTVMEKPRKDGLTQALDKSGSKNKTRK